MITKTMRVVLTCVAWAGLPAALWANSAPVVSNVAAVAGSAGLVEIRYNLADANYDVCYVGVSVSDDGGITWYVPATSFTGDVGSSIRSGAGKRIIWNAGADIPNRAAVFKFRVSAGDRPPQGMAIIPAGSFQMGDTFKEGDPGERPTHTVYISTFFMDRIEVTKGLWDLVETWATANGYALGYPGSGKAADHPVGNVDWFASVKWCNARSQKEGRTPCYYTNPDLTTVYKSGTLTPYVKWDATGYRLPTEAEWEKAARGGLQGRRYPWGDAIASTQANYAQSEDPYEAGSTPWTTPVGFFTGALRYKTEFNWPGTQPSYQTSNGANGYGLYDMAGNVWEWCYDTFGSYPASPQTNPTGPTEAGDRVVRGGGLGHPAQSCRVAERGIYGPGGIGDYFGFRSVLGSIGDTSTTWGDSPQVHINTVGLGTATVSGRVLAGGLPAAGASAAIQPGNHSAQTAPDGTFTVAGIPAGTGYEVRVIAGGYQPLLLSNRALLSGTNNLGDLSLTAITGTFILRTLVPDVNPDISEVEEGGTAYRYYRVVNQATGKAQGGVAVQVREVGGSEPIAQDCKPQPGYAGTLAGVSEEGSGIVRLGISAEDAGRTAGSSREFETVVNGSIGPSFSVVVRPRGYTHFWEDESQGGLHGKVNLFGGVRIAGKKGHRVRIARSYGSDPATEELIRNTAARLEVGVEVGPPIGGAAKINNAIIGSSLGTSAGGYGELNHGFCYRLNPNSTDDLTAALRLYCMYADLGDDLVPVMGPFIAMVREGIEPMLLGDVYQWSEGGFEAGAFLRADALLGAKFDKEFAVGLYGDVDIEGGLRVNQRYYVEKAQRETQSGFAAKFSAEGGLGIGFRPYAGTGRPAGFEKTMKNLGVYTSPSLVARGTIEQYLTTVTKDNAAFPHEVRLTTRSGAAISALGHNIWDYLQTGNQPDETDCMLEITVAQPISTREEWNQTSGLSAILSALFSVGDPILNSMFDVEAASVFFGGAEFEKDKEYEASIELVHRESTSIEGEATFIAGGGFSVKFDSAKGRGFLLERGKTRGGLAFPLMTTGGAAGIPVNETTIFDLQEQWFAQAASLWQAVLGETSHPVAEVGQTVVEAVTSAGSAVVEAAEGAWNAGTNIVVDAWDAITAGGQNAPSNFAVRAQSDTGAGTLAYGIGGMYRFAADSDPSQPVTLRLTYTDEQTAGLSESDLRIYRRDDAIRRWELVGGDVDTTANTVTVTVSQLGVFTLAPPLPAGKLSFALSRTMAPADGTSEVVAEAGSLLLNTGAGAEDGSVYTVQATGMEIVTEDIDTELEGVQVASSGGKVTIAFRSPTAGGVGEFLVRSVYGDAFGQGMIAFEDTTPPAVPTGLMVTSGQSKLYVSWDADSASADVTHYRLYYREGATGPPWDGTAKVDGGPSPIDVTGNSAVLRGLNLGSTYCVAVSAVDGSGNESATSSPVSATTVQSPPAPPFDVRSAADGTDRYVVSWGLSEDDGFNDRDVDHYEVYRKVGSNGVLQGVGTVNAGVSVYTDLDPGLAGVSDVRYAVCAVDAAGLKSDVVGFMIPADLDHDGDVDRADYDLFELCASGPGISLVVGCEDRDFDHDNDVDQSDFALFQLYYSGTEEPGGFPPIVNVLAPSVDQTAVVGDTVTVRYDAFNSPSGSGGSITVWAFYDYDGVWDGDEVTFATLLPGGEGKFTSFDTSEVPPGTVYIGISAENAVGRTTAYAPGRITLVATVHISFTLPQTDLTVGPGCALPIEFTAGNYVSDFTWALFYDRDGSFDGDELLIENGANTTSSIVSTEWTIPLDTPADVYYIGARVVTASMGENVAYAESTVTVTTEPYLQLLLPTPGTVVAFGTPIPIVLAAGDAHCGNPTIRIFVDPDIDPVNGNSTDLAMVPANTGGFVWRPTTEFNPGSYYIGAEMIGAVPALISFSGPIELFALAADFDKDGDVDVDDSAVFEECASGPSIPRDDSETCRQADFDGDNDVDQSDFGILQRCYSGAGIPGTPGCNEVVPRILPSRLTASDGATQDMFGFSACVSGPVVIVGDPVHYSPGGATGAAYVYRLDGRTWVQEAKLTVRDGVDGDQFGTAVSVSGNVAIVGGPLTDDHGPDSGSAYVFRYGGSSWVEEAELTALDGTAGDYFGYAVSADGSVAVVGAPSKDGVGAAYVFRWNGYAWVQDALLTPSDGMDESAFGVSVSMSGDVAVVGAPWHNNNVGSVYVFRWNGSSWAQEAQLTPRTGTGFNGFGTSVSLSGDVAVVGAPAEDDSAGTAYVFRKQGSTWNEEARIPQPVGAPGGDFGHSVGVSGDLIVVGGDLDDNSSCHGAAYVFRWNGATWVSSGKLRAYPGADGDYFGFSSSADNGVVVVGAILDSDASTYGGAAYVFDLSSPAE